MKTKCPECGKRYGGLHPKAACQLWAATRRDHKYGAIAQDGFPSRLERSTFGVLLQRQRAGDIRALKRYATVHLPFGIAWKLDFQFEQGPDWHLRYAESKGKWTADAGIKLKIYRQAGPAPLEIWMQGRGEPELVEIIIPKGKAA